MSLTISQSLQNNTVFKNCITYVWMKSGLQAEKPTFSVMIEAILDNEDAKELLQTQLEASYSEQLGVYQDIDKAREYLGTILSTFRYSGKISAILSLPIDEILSRSLDYYSLEIESIIKGANFSSLPTADTAELLQIPYRDFDKTWYETERIKNIDFFQELEKKLWERAIAILYATDVSPDSFLNPVPTHQIQKEMVDTVIQRNYVSHSKVLGDLFASIIETPHDNLTLETDLYGGDVDILYGTNIEMFLLTINNTILQLMVEYIQSVEQNNIHDAKKMLHACTVYFADVYKREKMHILPQSVSNTPVFLKEDFEKDKDLRQIGEYLMSKYTVFVYLTMNPEAYPGVDICSKGYHQEIYGRIPEWVSSIVMYNKGDENRVLTMWEHASLAMNNTPIVSIDENIFRGQDIPRYLLGIEKKLVETMAMYLMNREERLDDKLRAYIPYFFSGE